MPGETPSLGRGLRLVGEGVFGLVGTVGLAIGLLWAGSPVQRSLYQVFYLAVGPWSAEETATVLTFVLAGLLAIAVPTVIVTYHRRGPAHLRRLGTVLAGLIVLATGVVSASALLGVVSFLAAIVVVLGFLVAVPVGLYYTGIWPAGLAPFLGGVPALAVLLVLTGVGLGWGGGYDLVAREVPAATADDPAQASFFEVPQVRDDLLSPSASDETYAYCETDDGARTCHLPLRGYRHEAVVARWLDRHGVRCPYRGASGAGDPPRSFLATDGDRLYRVSCVAYGD